MGTQSRLFVISGPSGAGKGTLVSLLREMRPDLGLTVSATTRSPRQGEIPDVSYHFLSEEEFQRRVKAGDFLEWAHVHGHCYGTLKEDVKAQLSAGKSVILEIDVQGALNVKRLVPDAVLIFVEPPSMEELERRLRDRGTESEDQVELRLANAKCEMDLAPRYDVRLVNDKADAAVAQLATIMKEYETNGGSSYGSNRA